MSNKCSNCDYLLSVISNTKIKLEKLKESNEKVKENTEKMLNVINELSDLVDELKEKLKKSDN